MLTHELSKLVKMEIIPLFYGIVVSSEMAMKGYREYCLCSPGSSFILVAVGCVIFPQRFILGAGAKFVFFKTVIALHVGIVLHCRY